MSLLLPLIFNVSGVKAPLQHNKPCCSINQSGSSPRLGAVLMGSHDRGAWAPCQHHHRPDCVWDGKESALSLLILLSVAKLGTPSSWCHSRLCKQPHSRPHTDQSWRQQGAEPKAPGPEHCAQYSAALTTAVWGEMRKKRLSLPPWKPQTLHRPYKSPKRQLIRAFGVPPLTNPFPAPTHGCPGSRCG